MKIGIPKETLSNETKVAIIPEVVKKFKKLGIDVVIEKGAGEKSSYFDESFKDAGAEISDNVYNSSDVILKINAPEIEEVKKIKKGTVLICDMQSYKNAEIIEALANAKVDVFAMEKMPRISRAQSMDILSSQSSLAGYRAVIEAAFHFNKVLPMMMTSAGSVAPARVLIIGAGVAGLQAIATAKRLGAVVYASDVRASSKEQVESLGGRFVVVDEDAMKNAETKGGYAKEMDDNYKKKQEIVMQEQIKLADIVISTALIPGKPAPLLIKKEVVAMMKKGSVIIDLATSAGGNCELSQNDKIVNIHNVTIVGNSNLSANVSTDASAMFSRNLYNFISPFIKDKETVFDLEDETVSKTMIIKDGKILFDELKNAPKKTKSKDK